jgi:hypothetical protein
MEPSKNTLTRFRLIVLDKDNLANVLVELSLFPCFEEIASGIREYAGLYDIYTFYVCLFVFHRYY